MGTRVYRHPIHRCRIGCWDVRNAVRGEIGTEDIFLLGEHSLASTTTIRTCSLVVSVFHKIMPHGCTTLPILAAFFQICPTFTEKIADFRAKYVGLAWFHNPRIFVAKKSHIFVTCSTYIVEKCCVYFTQEQPFPPVAIGMLWSDVITRRHQKAAFFACSRIFRKFP